MTYTLFILLQEESFFEALAGFEELITLLLVLPEQRLVLLLPHLRLIARRHRQLGQSLQAVARHLQLVLRLGHPLGDLLFEVVLGAVGQATLRHLVVVVDDLSTTSTLSQINSPA